MNIKNIILFYFNRKKERRKPKELPAMYLLCLNNLKFKNSKKYVLFNKKAKKK